MKKIYSCCICHKELEYYPIRLVKQLHGLGLYKQYSHKCNYDFCKDCYLVFHKWILKHRKEVKRDY